MNVRFLKAAWEEDAFRDTRIHTYPRAAVERMVKVQEAILRLRKMFSHLWHLARLPGNPLLNELPVYEANVLAL